MTILRRLVQSLRAGLVRAGLSSDRDAEIEREMAFHVEMETAHNIADGMPGAEAHRRALIVFGGQQRFREEARDQQRGHRLADIMRDLAHAVRVFRRMPGLTAAIVLTLAVGIGATTVVFSVTDHVVLRALPYAHSDRLVNVQIVSDRLSTATNRIPANGAHLLGWMAGCSACDGVAALTPGSRTLTGAGDPVQLSVVRISDNFFSMLGATAERGRLFAPGDDRAGAPNGVVISEALWRGRFGARDDIVGRTITLADQPWQVLGVLSPDFQMLRGSELGSLAHLPNTTDAFVPLALTQQERTTHGGFDFSVIARLKPGASAATARAQFDAANVSVMQRMGETGPSSRTAVTPLRRQIVSGAARPLVLLLAAVAAMLLLMCVNLANLLLARSATRVHESAVRLALGAGRGRLIRQALTETTLLALIGGALGILVAIWGLHALLALAPADLPRIGEVHLDAPTLVGAVLLSLLAGVTFGIAPAWRFGHAAPSDALKEGGRASTGSRSSVHMRSLLIAAQVAMSALLLVAGGLLLKSFVRVLGVDKGFNSDHVLAPDVVLPRTAYPTREARNRLYETALARLAALPAVEVSALTNALPIEGDTWVDNLQADARQPGVNANFRFVSTQMFGALGQPLLRGRTFTQADRGRRVIILSDGATRALWPGQDPIGRFVHAGSDSTYEVIGVVADVRTNGLEHDGSAVAYKPYWEMGLPFATLLLRTRIDPSAVAMSARAVLRDVGPSIPVSRIRTMNQVVSTAVAQRRFTLVLIGVFALTALLTASLGLYGIIAHSLARRRNEIGIRIALGARTIDVHAMVLGEVFRPVMAGLMVGIGASVLAGRLLAGLLFEVKPADGMVLLSVVVVLASVAAIACIVPTYRAGHTDPVDALRTG